MLRNLSVLLVGVVLATAWVGTAGAVPGSLQSIELTAASGMSGLFGKDPIVPCPAVQDASTAADGGTTAAPAESAALARDPVHVPNGGESSEDHASSEPSTDDEEPCEGAAQGSASSDDSEATGVEGEALEDGSEGDEARSEGNEARSDPSENHGQAVRVAAHCEVKGRQHGELVRTIASDEAATAAGARAACQQAENAAESARGRDAHEDRPRPHDNGPTRGGKDHSEAHAGADAHGRPDDTGEPSAADDHSHAGVGSGRPTHETGD